MRKLIFILGFLVLSVFSITISLKVAARVENADQEMQEDEPDLPGGAKIDKEEFLRLRAEHVSTLQGMDSARPDSRAKSIAQMEQGERALAQRRAALNQPLGSMWLPLGPAPIPVNATTSNSGRVSAIAVHPTNPNIVYVGTAQGGLYRSVNGGETWTPLLDGALTLAIGAVAISPSDPSTVFVGTGESTLCSSGCFIGVGLYRITNADSNPVVSPVLNRDASGSDVFTGRAVSEIIVHPTNPNILFTTTTSGIAGIGASTTGLTLPAAGLYRTTNAMAANPTFDKIAVQGTLAPSRSITDLAVEPGNPNRMVLGVVGSGGDGGVYLSTDALAATPTFARTLTTGDGASLGRTEFAINKVGAVVTVYAATGTANGTLYKSIDGGAAFLPAGGGTGFCSTQCFYDIAVEVDPTDANKVYLGGSPSLVFGRSTTGGAAFTNSSSGLHVDTQAFALAPSDSNIMYFGSDGGIWRTTTVTTTGAIPWTTLNNSTFSATQFMGLALHPTDRHYLLGGTQDNGTEYLAPDGVTWIRSDGGDGGFAVIDQNATSPTNTVSYHTYFNQTTTQVGFERALTTEPNGDPFWNTFLGCRNGTSNNGILCADAVLFYAPLVRGPGNPNTIYYGSIRLYRSDNQGTAMTDVSGTLPARISAIAIAPQDDAVRLVGLTNGQVFLSTTAGATTMTNVTGSIPARYIGRIAIDPTNANVAYVALNGFGLSAGQHVWKTTNLLSGAPVWTAAGSGIPDTPTNAFVIDPANTQILYAGTDIGVFRSTNGGTSWEPFSDGLPRIAVFGMEIQAVHRVLRIATHGRGIWEMNLNVPSRRVVADFDGDGKTDVSVYRPADGTWYLNRSQAGFTAAQFGISSDRIVPGDYDGDGKTDLAVYRNGDWYIINSSNQTFTAVHFGIAADKPVQNDYDGDGKTDLAVYRPADGTWYLLRSQAGFTGVQFGLSTDVPTPADYDGDNKADISVFRPSDGTWYRVNSATAQFVGVQFGTNGDIPVPGDFDGDTRADVAVFRPSLGDWYVLKSSGGLILSHFGQNGDVPAPGDYDGDGKTDLAVYRGGAWYLLNSSSGSFNVVNFGVAADTPVPSRQNP
ncbi:MAG TPA: VCBS repeat-containing protein [Pyrinomonadaceae bacterium]|jgi:hypothetical protein